MCISATSLSVLIESRPLSDNAHLSLVLPQIASDSLAPARNRLHTLQSAPPQVLLFDGGTEEKRRSLAKYWAACTLCESATESGPCLSCLTCQQILEDTNPDVTGLDGTLSKKEAEDRDFTGFFRPFTAESSRELRTTLRASPHGRYRFVVITGIAGSRPEAPNALLKVLEEPSPHSLFVLLVPQRDQILPTLVSRAICMTLPWPDDTLNETEDVQALTTGFAGFLADEGDFLSAISVKSFMTVGLAQEFVIACQKSMIRVLSDECTTPLDHELMKLTVLQKQQGILWFREAQDMLKNPISPVTPLRVLEALCMRLYTFFH